MTDNTITLTADDTTANALVATIRAAVNGGGKYVAYVESHDVTRENVKSHAAALATLAYPHDKPVQKTDGKRTRFGNAVQAAASGLRAALGKSESDPATPDYLAAIVKATEAALEHGVEASTIAETIAQYI